jgi:hypothetical protein
MSLERELSASFFEVMIRKRAPVEDSDKTVRAPGGIAAKSI